jgi:steroid delta-isomerase-like uncharacterized protein
MSRENEAFIRRWFDEVWNKKSADAIDEMLDDDCVAHGLPDGQGGIVDNKEKFKALHAAFIDAYPDIQIRVEETMAEGDRAFARCTVTGTHKGEGLGFKATNRPVEFSGMILARIKDGKLIEVWNEFNFVAMYSALGVLTLADPNV